MTWKGSAHLLHLRSFTFVCEFILMQTKITKCTQEKMAVKLEVSVNAYLYLSGKSLSRTFWLVNFCLLNKRISCLRVALQMVIDATWWKRKIMKFWKVYFYRQPLLKALPLDISSTWCTFCHLFMYPDINVAVIPEFFH